MSNLLKFRLGLRKGGNVTYSEWMVPTKLPW